MNTVLTPGMLVGQRFVIEEATGKGGMGTVYRGRDTLRGDTVAVKLLRNASGAFDHTERFAREVQILAELCHPGIVSYVAHGVIDSGQPFLVMQWLEGEDLADRLRRQPLSPRESLILLRRIGEALEVAHRHTIVHRDLKPSTELSVSWLCRGLWPDLWPRVASFRQSTQNGRNVRPNVRPSQTALELFGVEFRSDPQYHHQGPFRTLGQPCRCHLLHLFSFSGASWRAATCSSLCSGPAA